MSANESATDARAHLDAERMVAMEVELEALRRRCTELEGKLAAANGELLLRRRGGRPAPHVLQAYVDSTRTVLAERAKPPVRAPGGGRVTGLVECTAIAARVQAMNALCEAVTGLGLPTEGSR